MRKSRTQRQKHFHENGFTLVEVLIVLLILGMVVALFFQSTLQLQNINDSAQRKTQTFQQQQIRRSWLHQIISNLYPLHRSRTLQVFQGDAQGFKGYSLTPLRARKGANIQIELRIQDNTAENHQSLIYKEHQIQYNEIVSTQEWVIFTQKSLQFTYLDDKMNSFTLWPPETAEEQSDLPKALLISGETLEGKPFLHMTTVMNRPTPKLSIRDL